MRTLKKNVKFFFTLKTAILFHDINYEMTLNGVPLNSVFNSGLCTSCRKKSVMCRIFKRYSLIKNMESIIAKRTFIIKKNNNGFQIFFRKFLQWKLTY